MRVVIDKDIYANFCSINNASIFHQPWWLDAVCKDGDWSAMLILNDNDLPIASLPVFTKQKRGVNLITQPKLTPYQGPFILRPQEMKYSTFLSTQKECMNTFIDALPKYAFYIQNWLPEEQNWLPFYWRGFKQTTYYTYRIPKGKLSDVSNVWKDMQGNIRREIKKASKRFQLRLIETPSLDDFLHLNKKTFDRQTKKVPVPTDIIRAIDDVCSKKKCRKIFIVKDAQGRSHAGVYLIWDENYAYYLMGGADPKLRNSGASSLCMWEAISFASTKGLGFDFEGSMIEPVERFIRAFGAEQVPYHQVYHAKSKILKVFFLLKN